VLWDKLQIKYASGSAEPPTRSTSSAASRRPSSTNSTAAAPRRNTSTTTAPKVVAPKGTAFLSSHLHTNLQSNFSCTVTRVAHAVNTHILHLRTHIYTHTRTHTLTHTRIPKGYPVRRVSPMAQGLVTVTRYTHAHTRAHTHTSTNMHTHTCTHTHAHTQVIRPPSRTSITSSWSLPIHTLRNSLTHTRTHTHTHTRTRTHRLSSTKPPPPRALKEHRWT
jgi:hypothetical protein